MIKPYSESCEENKQPILEILKTLFKDIRTVLEIGSGTGQHAVYFTQEMPHLIWQCSDLAENIEGIKLWLAEGQIQNMPEPIVLDVANKTDWPQQKYDAVFSANAIHIMSWPHVEKLIENAAKVLNDGGLLVFYGPFNYDGQYTSESNANFDLWLKQRDPLSGIRDFEAVSALTNNAGLELFDDFAMPANNRILAFQKQADT